MMAITKISTRSSVLAAASAGYTGLQRGPRTAQTSALYWGELAVGIFSVIPETTHREAVMTTMENHTSTPSGQRESLPSDLREGYADIGDVRLHYVEAGEGPLIVLLHGFPEFWYGWRRQIGPLAAAGFRVVAPDMRGYNLSSRPKGVKAYQHRPAHRRPLRSDRRTRCRVPRRWSVTMGRNRRCTAMNHPEVVDRLVILNAATVVSHRRDCTTRASSASPGTSSSSTSRTCPSPWCTPTSWHFFRHFLHDASPAYTPEEIDRYIQAWSQPGAATGMINYYRSSVRTSPKKAEAALRPISAPTLVIWGQRDNYLGPELAEPDHDDVPNLDRVERLPDASHWVHHDEAERVNQLLIDFFGPALPASNR